MALLCTVVETSQRVSETPRRLEKIQEIAACLRSVTPEEIPIAIAYLSGETCQGKLGVGFGSLQGARSGNAATQPSLSLHEVDRAFADIAQIKGKGSNAQRTEALRS